MIAEAISRQSRILAAWDGGGAQDAEDGAPPAARRSARTPGHAPSAGPSPSRSPARTRPRARPAAAPSPDHLPPRRSCYEDTPGRRRGYRSADAAETGAGREELPRDMYARSGPGWRMLPGRVRSQ